MKYIFSLLLCIFMIGCSNTTYDDIASSTAEGLQCTAQCNMIYNGCIANILVD